MTWPSPLLGLMLLHLQDTISLFEPLFESCSCVLNCQNSDKIELGTKLAVCDNVGNCGINLLFKNVIRGSFVTNFQ